MSHKPEMAETADGDWVTFEEYKELADYADRLVDFGKPPCLPKDLENLREANTRFAQDNHTLQSRLDRLVEKLKRLNI